MEKNDFLFEVSFFLFIFAFESQKAKDKCQKVGVRALDLSPSTLDLNPNKKYEENNLNYYSMWCGSANECTERNISKRKIIGDNSR